MNPPTVDVLFLLEGTYPYVRGGVSSWIHEIIKASTDLTFGIMFIGASPEQTDVMHYQLPDNVVYLETCFLSQSLQPHTHKSARGDANTFAVMEAFHHQMQEAHPDGIDPDTLSLVYRMLREGHHLNHASFLRSQEAMNMVNNLYREYSTEASYLNYFWTVRSMHAPLFSLAKAATAIPSCRMLHSLSTGYAGFLGALIKQQRPELYFLLSEHGIYTKERKIDLAQAQWIDDRQIPSYTGLDHSTGYVRSLWIQFFEFLGKATYMAADQITCLYEGNRLRQITEGAPPEKIRLVPNGISITRFQPALERRTDTTPMVIGLAGRIVPIKDVKTFIRAIDIARQTLPGVEGWILGPMEEDPAYVQECFNLVEQLQLGQQLRFCGFQSLPDTVHQLGLLVLTSISEAQPLVVLEGFAAGIPSVCTDVGSCRELVLGGSNPDDQAIGAAGAIVGIADPQAVADACTGLLANPERWHAAQKAALNRVHRWYTDEQMFQRYHGLYQQGMAYHARQVASEPATCAEVS